MPIKEALIKSQTCWNYLTWFHAAKNGEKLPGCLGCHQEILKKKKISQFKASISGLTVLEYIHVLNVIDLFLFCVCVRWDTEH